MLKLDVPFVPDGDYPAFLAAHKNTLGCVHFSLYDPALSDARQLMESRDTVDIQSGLVSLGETPRYVLMNARLHAPDKYFSAKDLDATAQRLNELVKNASVSGVIFADFYFLQALSDAHPKLAGKLEGVPSINALLSSPERVFAALDGVARTNFKIPSKIVLDRCLNRDMNRLETTSIRLRSQLPETELYLMANEGCLYECPYKPAHDAHIALVNEGVCPERTFAMNRDFGCIRRLLDDPAAMLASPFIRPEDMDCYSGLVDGIKLCGRNRGIDFLKRTVTAYLKRTYPGNLLDLMDAMGDLADRVTIANARFPADFLDRVSACTKHCSACGWCAKLAGEIISHNKPELASLK